MQAGSRPKVSKSILILGAAGMVALLFYLFYFVGISNFVSTLQKVDLLYYCLAFVLVAANVLAYALAWRSLLKTLSIKIKVRAALSLTWVGIFVDTLVPSGLSGDLFKSYWLSKTSSQDAGKIVASTIAQKILIILITMFSLALGLLFWFSGHSTLDPLVFNVITSLAVILSATMGAILCLSSKPAVTVELLKGIARLICYIRRNKYDFIKLQNKAKDAVDAYHTGIVTLRARPRTLARSVVFTLAAWAADLATFLLCFYAIGYSVPPYTVLVTYALTATLAVEGFSFLGFNEIVRTSLFVALGIPPNISLTVTLLNRFATFWFKLIVSYPIFHLTILTTRSSDRSSEQHIEVILAPQETTS